jgi:peptide/nickel transport system substrate-binding protein
VQESDWNCALMVTPNHERKPMDDARVRRALSLSIDRWGGSSYLSKIAIVKTVGGIVFPGHPLAATEAELDGLAGYGKDLKANRAEAMRLLKEAGVSNLELDMNNRGSDQPYKVVGTWLIDQWRQIGVKVTQNVKPTPQFYAAMRQTREFDISMDFNCQSVVNPILDITKYLPTAGNNYTGWKDDKVEALYDRILRSGQESEQRSLIREMEKYVLDEQASQIMTLWWYKINPHRSYVKGWKIAPSHYLNQQLDTVWIDPKLR